VFKGNLRGTDVAVKRLLAANTTKEVLQEFELECAIMAYVFNRCCIYWLTNCSGLRHPNIVLFMGSCYVLEDKEVLLVMELMEKGSLHDVIHNPKVVFNLSY
jgi:serine/threonine protein kinase